MRHAKGWRLPAVALVASVVLAAGAGVALAEPEPVRFDLALSPGGWSNGATTGMIGTFSAQGALTASGTAGGSYGFPTWEVRLFCGDGTIDVRILEGVAPATWEITAATGAYAGLGGGGTGSVTYWPAPWPAQWEARWTLTGTVGPAPPHEPCDAPTPTLLSAVPGNGKVTLTWSDESADPEVVGYRVHVGETGQWRLASDGIAAMTSTTVGGLTNGVTYCFKVTSYHVDCESGFSNVLCATPVAVPEVEVAALLTGRWVKSGKGKHATEAFEGSDVFDRGDSIVFRIRIVDRATGLPVAGAVAELLVTGPESRFVTTGPSDAAGCAEAAWKTSAPKKKGTGGTAPGIYGVTTTSVSVAGYDWDGVPVRAGFTIR
jgi:hypothetical protein